MKLTNFISCKYHLSQKISFKYHFNPKNRWSGKSSKRQVIEHPLEDPFIERHTSLNVWQVIEHPYSGPIHRIYYKT